MRSYTGNATALGVRTTRTEYASSTTVGDPASARSCLLVAVSAPMQGRQRVCRTSPTRECIFGSAFNVQSVSSFHSTICAALREFFAKVLPSSLYRDNALLIARLTLESQTIDLRRFALVGCMTHDNTTYSCMLASV